MIKIGANLKDIDIDIGSSASMEIVDRKLTITGTVLNPDIRKAFGKSAEELVPDLKVDNRLGAAQITFATDSAEITDLGKRNLKRISKVLINYDAIEIEGHTDKSGEAGFSLDLSQRRAESVKSYLISLGFAAEKLTAKGYSDTRPVVCNVNFSRRNRRIEFRILGESTKAASPDSYCQ